MGGNTLFIVHKEGNISCVHLHCLDLNDPGHQRTSSHHPERSQATPRRLAFHHSLGEKEPDPRLDETPKPRELAVSTFRRETGVNAQRPRVVEEWVRGVIGGPVVLCLKVDERVR